jgi:sulfatase maturation enzyme AslB (radical SAM superfamily)
MSNVMINKVCNLKCPYCFANEFVNKEDKNNITEENFKKAIDFIVKSGRDYIGIIGGEPTLHPNFEKLAYMAINHDNIREVRIFTNGITLDKYIKLFSHHKVTALINLNSPNDIGKKNFDKVISNLMEFEKYNYIEPNMTLGINMYKPDFDYEYFLDTATRFNVKGVRVAIAVPNNIAESRNSDPLEYFSEMKPRIFQFFKELKKLGIVPSYDCNLMPLCITTDEEKEFLKSFTVLRQQINLNNNPLCDPVIDILPDLKMVRCFGCSEICKADMEHFERIQQVSDFFAKSIDVPASLIDASPKCKTCLYQNTGRCTGGCIAFKQQKLIKLKYMINDFNEEREE